MITSRIQFMIEPSLAYREVETAEALLSNIKDALKDNTAPDLRDAFGRSQAGLQLGVQNGQMDHRLFNVEWALACPIIEAHIAKHRAIIEALSQTARIELAR